MIGGGSRRRASCLVAILTAPLSAHAEEYGATVTALDNAFSPQIVRVAVGRVGGVANDGRSAHTVTANDGSWDSGNLEPGQAFERTFDAARCVPLLLPVPRQPQRGHDRHRGRGRRAAPRRWRRGSGSGTGTVPTHYEDTVRVPADFPTIQAGRRSRPARRHGADRPRRLHGGGNRHDAVHHGPRGQDRNRTMIDGEFQRANGIQVIEADGVVIQNMTVRNELAQRLLLERRPRILGLVSDRLQQRRLRDLRLRTPTMGSSTTRTRAAHPIRASTSGSAIRATR